MPAYDACPNFLLFSYTLYHSFIPRINNGKPPPTLSYTLPHDTFAIRNTILAIRISTINNNNNVYLLVGGVDVLGRDRDDSVALLGEASKRDHNVIGNTVGLAEAEYHFG